MKNIEVLRGGSEVISAGLAIVFFYDKLTHGEKKIR